MTNPTSMTQELVDKFEHHKGEINKAALQCLAADASPLNSIAVLMALSSVAAMAIIGMESSHRMLEICRESGTNPRDLWNEYFANSLDQGREALEELKMRRSQNR
jgi:hypothetical protein